jgi:hypothetical protein
MNKDKVEITFIVVDALRPMHATVDRHQLAESLQEAARLAKARGLRPGEPPDFKSGKVLHIGSIAGSAERLATIIEATKSPTNDINSTLNKD